jgi:hypothetical protein
MAVMKNASMILVQKLDRKRPLGRCRCKCNANIKMGLKEDTGV